MKLTTSDIIMMVEKTLKKSLNAINENYYEPNEIGSISIYDCNFDEDDYQDYLNTNNIQDSTKTKIQYIKDNCSFELEYKDSEYFHHMDYDVLYYDDIADKFNEQLANDILMSYLNNNNYYNESFDVLDYMFDDDSNVDTNNIHEIENDAMKKLKHGPYYDGARGFILTNGTMVYTEAEHNMITRVAGISDKYFPIKNLGWIRVLPNSINIGKIPTEQQQNILYKIIDYYKNQTLYIDMFKNGSEHPFVYEHPSYRKIINDIRLFYSNNNINNNNISHINENNVDELIAYHGSHTNPNMTKFEDDFEDNNDPHRQKMGYGIYVAVNPERSANYANLNGGLYQVEIPDDNGKNYLYADRKIPKSLSNKIKKYIINQPDVIELWGDYIYDELHIFDNCETENLYGNLNYLLGHSDDSPKRNAYLLHSFGFAGMKNTASKKFPDDDEYVIFHPSDVKIIQKINM